MPYWFIIFLEKIVGGRNFQACAEKVKSKQSYLGTRINKTKDRQCGTVCIQKLSNIKVKACHSLKVLYNIRCRLKRTFCLPQVKTKKEHPRIY